MAKKGKFWKRIFTKEEEEKREAEKRDRERAEGSRGPPPSNDSESKAEELPSEPCRFCYDGFENGDDAYKCFNCGTHYHFPKCLKGQTNCRVCGEKVIERGNVVKLIRFRNVVCPKCGMKIKLFYGTGPKLHVNCPSCGHEGYLPNPYLGLVKKEAEAEEEYEEGEGVEEEEEVEYEEGAEDIDFELETEVEATEEVGEEEEVDEGPKIIGTGRDTIKKRIPKLVLLEQSVTCNVCLGAVKTGLPVVVCRCGKKYHESCATRVGECPTCDADLHEVEKLVKEEPEIELSEEDMEAFSEGEAEKTKKEAEKEAELEEVEEEAEEVEEEAEETEAEEEAEVEEAEETEAEEEAEEEEEEPEPEPELELELKLSKHNTFGNYTVNDQNRILYSILHGIAEAPAKEFNLVYIYGKQDLGKTHLLHAVGNYILENNPDFKVRYATILQIFSELDRAQEIEKVDEFQDYYKDADIFLIDDFQDIPKTKASQDIFFKIFGRLVESKKQILITSDRPVDQIKTLNKNIVKKLLTRIGITINLFESSIKNG